MQQNPHIVNLDVVLDANGNISSIALQPDKTKGEVFVLIDVENTAANAAYDAATDKNAAEVVFAKQALLAAQRSIFYTSASAAQKAALQAQLAAMANATVLDQTE